MIKGVGGWQGGDTANTVRRIGLGVVVHLLLLLLWYLAVELGDIPKFILPSPQDTVATLADAHYRWGYNSWVTIQEIFGGYFLAVGVGVQVGVGISVAIAVGVSVAVTMMVGVNVGVKVTVGVAADVAVGVKVAVAVGVKVAVGATVGVKVTVGVAVAVAVGVSVAVSVTVIRRSAPGRIRSAWMRVTVTVMAAPSTAAVPVAPIWSR